MEKTNQSNSFAIIGTFLIFELLAFAGFSLANSVLLYGIVGFAILLLLILGTKIEFKSKGFSSFLYFVIPLFIYGVLLFVSNFSLLFDLTDNIFVPVALIAFSGIGALSREQGDFKLSNAPLFLFTSIGIISFLILINILHLIEFQVFLCENKLHIYEYFFHILDNNLVLENMLLDLAVRTQVEEIADFAEIFAIAKRTVGNLREIISDTSAAIGEKIEMQRELRVLIASKQLEHKIMCLVPFLIIGYIGFTSKGYFDSLYHNVSGFFIMTACLAVYFGALYWGKKITDISMLEG